MQAYYHSGPIEIFRWYDKIPVYVALMIIGASLGFLITGIHFSERVGYLQAERAQLVQELTRKEVEIRLLRGPVIRK